MVEFTEYNLKMLKAAVINLKAISHKLRIKIIDHLRKVGSATVTEVYIALRCEQSVASQHLAWLRDAGVVTTERQGKYIKYKVNETALNTILECAGVIAED